MANTNPQPFHWHSRAKTGGPENVNGDIETLASHVTDENSHPYYLKKGQVVPSGEAQIVFAQHVNGTAGTSGHSKHFVRRDELMVGPEDTVLAYYNQVKGTDYSNMVSNWQADNPRKHVITAYILNIILGQYVLKSEMPRNWGDGTNLIYVDEHGNYCVSNANIGTEKRPVYLKNGRITALPSDSVLVDGSQIINGKKRFSSCPSVTSIEVSPSAPEDFVTIDYLRRFLVPVGFCVTTNLDFTTSQDVHDALGFGVWQLKSEIGNFAYMWERIE